MNRSYSQEEMSLVSYLERSLRVPVKDVISGKKVTIVVDQGSLSKALGKGASNIKRLERVMKKPVRMVEFNEDIELVAKQLIYPAQVKDIAFCDGTLTIEGADMKSRGMIIGRDRTNLSRLKETLSRYFSVHDVVVK